MDGRGRYLDNIFIERLWRSLKQEAVYLHEITDGFQAKRIIDTWIGFPSILRAWRLMTTTMTEKYGHDGHAFRQIGASFDEISRRVS